MRSTVVDRRTLVAGLITILTVLDAPALAQPLAPPGAGIDVPGGRLSYETGGSGSRTVIFVHDGFTDSAVWDPIWPILGREYNVVRYDRRGHGRSPAATAPYSPSEDLAALMRRLNLNRAAFIAGSDGAGLAAEFALAHPAQVEQLLLVSPLIGGAPRPTAWQDRLASATPADPAALAADRYIVNGPNRSARARLRAIFTAAPQDLGHADPLARLSPPLLPRLAAIAAPTMILVGQRDMPDAVAMGEAVQHAIPRARRDPVQGAGHLIYLDEPEIFAAAALAFIRSYGSQG
jgi:3-oxoadipate enol-lactonase